MIIRKKKKPLLIIILAAVLAVALAVAIILGSTILKPDTTTPTKVPPQIIDGEALFNGSAVAFPQVPESKMDIIRIVGREYEYALMRDEPEDGSLGVFMLYYRDANGDLQMYYPAINEYDPTFNYEDIYATVSFGDYGNIPILTYLGVAIGTAYFEERIPVSEYIDEREEQLKNYGLSLTDDYITISYKYTYELTDDAGEKILDENGNPKTGEATRKIKVGEPLVTGAGYYFMVDDRPYVYSTTNNYFDYAMLGFTDLINPILTAAGLPQDSSFEPYLTTDYQHWKNQLHKTEGEIVPEGATVIVNSDAIASVSKDTEITDDNLDGYLRDGFASLSLDLGAYADHYSFSKIAAALTGQKVGKLPENLYLTLTTYSKTLDLKDGVSRIGYKIVAVESILTDKGDITEAGTPVGDNDLVKATYYLINDDGKLVSYNTLHAVIDLTSPCVPAEVVEALRGAKIGALPEYLEFSVDYTAENSISRNISLHISEIIKITDKNEKDVKKAALGTTVIYRYYIMLDGVRTDGDYLDKITITEDLTGDAKIVADALIGQTCAGNLNLKVISYTEYSEFMADFICYEIDEIKCFITKRMIAGFEFQQASKRDPYYGESLYKNTTNNENRLYALNASACEKIVQVLGGLGQNTSSSLGLIGLETVEIGLTPDVLTDEKYGLYAYTLYFELPRGITSVVYSDSDQTLNEYLNTLDDYTYYSTLGFTLYVSEEKIDEDGKKFRYIASDMYDLVAKVPAEDFVFLKYEFTEFYARNNMVLTDISNIKTVTVEFMMKDLYGKYINELSHTVLFAYEGKIYTESTLPEGAWDTASEFDGINVFVTPVGECTPNKLLKFMSDKGYTLGVSLYELYGGGYVGVDNVGTSYFKEFTETLFYTYYTGTIDKELQSDIIDGSSPIMRLTVTLGKHGENSGSSYVPTSSFDYVYEFYRYSDGCVMVRVFRQNRTTGAVIEEVSDFYITTFAFKKMVFAYLGLLNVEEVNNDLPFATESGADAYLPIVARGKE